MGTDKRERQKANRAARREEEAKAAVRAQRRNRITYSIVAGLLAVALLFGVRAILTSGDDDTDTATSTTTLTIPDDGDEPTDDGATVTTEAANLEPVEPECPPEDGTDERFVQFTEAPPMCIDETATYLATFETTEGTFTVEMDASRAPETVNNFVFLARNRYYDGVPFHRIIPGFVVQGGDAVSETAGAPLGTGGPGYTFADELPEAGEYQIGSVAMANSGEDTNGSQFFVITGQQGVELPPSYALFGEVVDGLDVVQALESLGSGDGTPTADTRMLSVTISEA